MASNFARLAMLAVFSGLSVNLILQLGLGIKRIAFSGEFISRGKPGRKRYLIELALFFITVILLWPVFSFARSILFLGLLEYILVFPVSLFVFSMLEYFSTKIIRKLSYDPEEAILYGGTLSGASLFITLNTAGSFLDAMILSAGYAAGIALAIKIISEIRLRSEMEAVPKSLQGSPLVLIAMGLLSLVFSAAALMLYQVLGAK